MDFDNKVAEEDHNITSKNIRDFYFHDLKLSSSTFQNFVKVFCTNIYWKIFEVFQIFSKC